MSHELKARHRVLQSDGDPRKPLEYPLSIWTRRSIGVDDSVGTPRRFGPRDSRRVLTRTSRECGGCFRVPFGDPPLSSGFYGRTALHPDTIGNRSSNQMFRTYHVSTQRCKWLFYTSEPQCSKRPFSKATPEFAWGPAWHNDHRAYRATTVMPAPHALRMNWPYGELIEAVRTGLRYIIGAILFSVPKS